MKPSKKLICESLEFWGIHLEADHLTTLMRYAEVVDRYEKANITGAKDVDDIVRNHVTDSLSCLVVGELSEAASAVDVGSGGGFPAIPLAIATSPTKWTMVESTGKKAKFLEDATSELGLMNTVVVADRVEEVGRTPEYRGGFDVATARAVASLDVLVEYCVPLLRSGGVFVAMKARLEDAETDRGSRAAKILGAEIESVVSVSTPPGIEDRERNLVVVKKTRKTPGKYPRGVGIPKKVPLGT